MEDNIFGLDFDQQLGNAEIFFDCPDYNRLKDFRDHYKELFVLPELETLAA